MAEVSFLISFNDGSVVWRSMTWGDVAPAPSRPGWFRGSHDDWSAPAYEAVVLAGEEKVARAWLEDLRSP